MKKEENPFSCVLVMQVWVGLWLESHLLYLFRANWLMWLADNFQSRIYLNNFSRILSGI